MIGITSGTSARNGACTIPITRTITTGTIARTKLTGTGWTDVTKPTSIMNASNAKRNGSIGTGGTSTKSTSAWNTSNYRTLVTEDRACLSNQKTAEGLVLRR